MIEMTAVVRDAIVADALRRRPEESCGLVSAAGRDGVIDRFHPVRNDAASPTRFRLDPAEMLAVEAAVEAGGRTIVGVVHSHTATSPAPSPTDRAESAVYDPDGSLHQIIVSLAAPEASMRSYRIVGGAVTEEAIIVTEPEPTVHDQAGAAAAVVRLPSARPGPR